MALNIKRKTHPLVEQGHKVFVSYENSKAFGSRSHQTSSGYRYLVSRSPSSEFLEWIATTAGPREILWHVEKAKDKDGLDIFFYNPSHAMLTKLTWGGH